MSRKEREASKIGKLFNTVYLSKDFGETVNLLRVTRGNRGRVWLCGNGGSHHTVSHFGSDLANLGFDVFCMTDSPSRITALTNDSGWGNVYADQMFHFKPGDLLVVASVHGGSGEDRAGPWSQNLVKACELSRIKSGRVLSFVGGDGGVIKNMSDVCLHVSDGDAYVVEGLHSVLTHMICLNIKGVYG